MACCSFSLEKKMDNRRVPNIYVGSEIGILKGIDVSKSGINYRNLNDVSDLVKTSEVQSLCWGGDDEKVVLMGLKNQYIYEYNTEKEAFTSGIDLKEGDNNDLLSICRTDGKLLTSSSNGVVKVWSASEKVHQMTFLEKSEESLCVVKASPFQTGVIATAGKEADLKLWDINNGANPVFKAKNVLPDFLQLRVPVWNSDVTFFPDQTIGVCTRHSHIRLYDPRGQRRRPVVSFDFEDTPLTSICVTCRNRQVMVGSGKGRLALFDLRKGQCSLLRCFKGSKGAVRQIVAHPSIPVTASVGLDRYMLLHNTVTGHTINKLYLNSRLNCVLMKTDITEADFNIKRDVLNQSPSIRENKSSGKIKKRKKKKTQKDALDKLIAKELQSLR